MENPRKEGVGGQHYDFIKIYIARETLHSILMYTLSNSWCLWRGVLLKSQLMCRYSLYVMIVGQCLF